LKNLALNEIDYESTFRSGQPHTPIIGPLLELSVNRARNDNVIFPHRLNSDKQPEIAEHLQKKYTDITFTQKLNLSKAEYYNLLSRSKVVFSCALHENLGISVMEGVLAGCIPVVPDRASYSEMYLSEFKYPSEWTSSYENYIDHFDMLTDFIDERLDNYNKYYGLLVLQRNKLIDKYLTPTVMINNIIR
jgi:hypothetical protein